MKKLVFILIIISGLTTYAQDYQYIPMVKPGLQIWTTYFGITETPVSHYNRFALTEEDTVIESETYKKLYWFQDSVFNSSTAECIGGIRENDNRQVFYKGKAEYDHEYWPNRMLYDFSLSIGDTFLGNINTYLRVLSIDTVEINNIQRRKFNIIEIFRADTNYMEGVGNWIEGIGDMQGILYSIYHLLIHSSGGFLRCYEYNGELQYHYGKEGCSNTVGLNDIEKDKAEILVYPIPAKDDINFSCSFMIKDIEIYDIMGRRVLKTEVKDYSKTINISSYTKGSYIAKLNTEQGLVSKKFIVE
ncbi:MAG: hypothetical protein H6Q15_239 [Bacteroidetes bacterium]|nr:hypothetical protein [Bacteroidota bacterium]